MPRDFVNLSKKQQKRVIKQELHCDLQSKKIRFASEETSPGASNSTIVINRVCETKQDSTSHSPKRFNLGSNTGHSNLCLDISGISSPSLTVETADSLADIHSNDSDDVQVSSKYSQVQNTLISDLCAIFTKHNASQSFITDMLDILRRHGHQSLPKDARTLMNTPKSGTHNLLDMDGGKYIHFGLLQYIEKVLRNHKPQDTNLKLNINIDGLPLAKSSRSQFWPILGDILLEDVYTEPFIIGVFHGFSKPKDSEEFLKPFIDDFKNLEVNGIFFEGVKYNIQLNCIICDAPAKAYLLNTIGHTGYFSCTKCVVEGDLFQGKVIFLETKAALRTNESFRNKMQPEHHHGPSAFEILNIDMVARFPLDYMHLILLGVTKKIISLWLGGNKEVRLIKTQINDLEEAYVSTKGYIIYEFSRKPRSFASLAMWKATEYRLFLLYIGPVILKNILHTKAYQHFLSLAVGVRLLCAKNLNEESITYASQLLTYFVKKFGHFFGYENYSHNVHNLIHIAADVKMYGSLDKFSAFKYENKFTKVKDMLKNSRFPLQQIYNRISEVNLHDQKIALNFPKIIFKSNKIFKVQLPFATFSLKFNENCCLLNDKRVVLIQKFNKTSENEIICLGRVYKNIEPFFNTPCNSVDMLCISQTNNRNLSKKLISFNVKEISTKCLRLQMDENIIVIPLLHH